MHKAILVDKHNGFTLVEIIVALVVLMVALPVINMVLFGLIRQQTSLNRLSEIKRQGDAALSAIKVKVSQEATGMYYDPGTGENQVCISASPNPEMITHFKDSSGRAIQYSVDANDILQYTFNGSIPVDITSSNIVVSNLSIQCIKRTAYVDPLVSVQFTVGYSGEPSAMDINPSLTYSTFIIIRD